MKKQNCIGIGIGIGEEKKQCDHAGNKNWEGTRGSGRVVIYQGIHGRFGEVAAKNKKQKRRIEMRKVRETRLGGVSCFETSQSLNVLFILFYLFLVSRQIYGASFTCCLV